MATLRLGLNQDFARQGQQLGYLDPMWTFTRASTATWLDAAGVTQTAPIDTPRLPFAAGICRGLEIETGERCTAALAPWWQEAAGTIIATIEAGCTGDTIVDLPGGNGRIALTRSHAYFCGSSIALAAAPIRIGIAWGAGSASLAVDGALVAGLVYTAPSGHTSIDLGTTGGASALGGCIQKFVYLPWQLDNATLCGATAQDNGGAAPSIGSFGWIPELAVIADGDRRVLQVTGWTGGTGTPPPSGSYVGMDGYTAAIANAVDIRGGNGADGSPGQAGATGPAGPTTPATATVIGAVKPGYGLSVATDGTLAILLSAIALAFFGFDAFTDYADGALAAPWGGLSWAANGVISVPELAGYDAFTDYADGTLNAPSGGSGWAANGVISVPELAGYDAFTDYADGTLNAPSGGSGWPASGAASVPN